jgi:hypothetical protein
VIRTKWMLSIETQYTRGGGYEMIYDSESFFKQTRKAKKLAKELRDSGYRPVYGDMWEDHYGNRVAVNWEKGYYE